MKATVLVRPKPGILDPQGEAVESSLRQLGFPVGDARVGRVIDLGAWKYLTCAICFLIFFLAVILPVFVLLWSSVIPYYGVPSYELVGKITWANFSYILRYPLARTELENSFLLSVGSATLVMLLTSVIAWITVKTKLPGRALLDTMAFIPIAMPGIVLGVSLIWVYLTLPIPIYGTIWVLLLAYITKYIPYGIRAASASMIQINKELEEASLTAGGTWTQTFRKVILPLLMPGLDAGWIYIITFSVRELSSSILLYSPGNEVLSVRIFELYESGRFTELAALGVVMMLALFALAALAYRVGARLGAWETTVA
jgi:iron(III) transport system permease protein